MTSEEHHDIITILTTETWNVRPKLLAYMKTVKVEEIIENVPNIEDEGTEVSTGLVAPQEAPVALNLDGTEKVPYPEWDGPVNWESAE